MNGSSPKQRRFAIWMAYGLVALGTAVIIYLVYPSSSGGKVPGWEPVNEQLEVALDNLNTESASARTTVKPSATSQQANPEVPKPSTTISPPASSSEPLAAASPLSANSNSSSGQSAGLIDLNTATVEVLDQLPGIGPSKAKAIAEYRDQKGGFRKVEELLDVKGIGPKLLDKIKKSVTIGAFTNRQ